MLDRGQPGLMRWILLWIMPLVQDRLLDLLASSPAHYHCATAAPIIQNRIDKTKSGPSTQSCKWFLYRNPANPGVSLKPSTDRLTSVGQMKYPAEFSLQKPQFITSAFEWISLMSIWRDEKADATWGSCRFCSHWKTIEEHYVTINSVPGEYVFLWLTQLTHVFLWLARTTEEREWRFISMLKVYRRFFFLYLSFWIRGIYSFTHTHTHKQTLLLSHSPFSHSPPPPLLHVMPWRGMYWPPIPNLTYKSV